MKRWVLSILMAVATAAAQEPEQIEKMIELKYLEAEHAERAVRLVREVSEAKIVSDSILKKIIIKGRPDRVAAAEKLLRSLDTPDVGVANRRIEVTIRLIGGFLDPAAKRGDEVPAELEPVIKEMRAAFGYKAYSLVDTFNIGGVVGASAQSIGRVANLSNSPQPPPFHFIRFDRSGVDRDTKSIALRHFEFALRPAPAASNDGLISTDVLIRPGQKLVLGNIRSADSTIALFLVISAKVD